ncbi:phytase [Epithele typhae]|uniref:phytase n=1 Tax=Epithele typhae TaxID=378194 RepID=UPI002008D32B|nr:phytase [Epithele typhae]KAH9940025.1 phytase [Epithele typhae]
MATSANARTTSFAARHLLLAYVAGILSVLLLSPSLSLRTHLLEYPLSTQPQEHRPGETQAHEYPPPSPTNAFPSLFPTDVGYAGPTPTGAEPAVIATAPANPIHTGAPHLLPPLALKNASGFDLFTHLGNLSPWFTVKPGTFGVDAGPEPPQGCRITGLHLLHRHGARYPTASSTAYGGPAAFAARLHDSPFDWRASGPLKFLNDWSYKLGAEILTPFGRQQLFDLGVSMRMKYGFLLKNFTDTDTLPVFRTESQDRMLSSALNFALGFFGPKLDGQYQQLITIEAAGFNNTLAPSKTCPNARNPTRGDRAVPFVREWAETYLQGAFLRLSPMLKGFPLTIEDVYTMQQLCAYETISIGYSKFCEVFTEDEWRGFDYSVDLYFWHISGFGSPVARAQGIGYIQELLARLTHTPIPFHNSTTNATITDNPATFPLGQSLYVDATHDTVILNVITALNLSNFAANGPLPTDHIPPHRAFKTSHLAPFASNLQFQLLSCASKPDPQIRVVINDGVAPLSSVRGCADDGATGMCALPAFVAAQRETVARTDWAWACLGEWEVAPGHGWNTTTGEPPARRADARA